MDTITDEYGVRYITGTAVNTGTANYRFVQIEAEILDPSGSVIASPFTNVNNVGPGDAWKFRIMVQERGQFAYRIR